MTLSSEVNIFTLISDQEDYDAFEEVAAMDPATIAKQLEKASNIKDLEERYIHVYTVHTYTSDL